MAPTPDWSTFAGVAGVLTVLLLMLARASEGVIVEAGRDGDADAVAGPRPVGDAVDDPVPAVDDGARPVPRGLEQLRDGTAPSTGALLANVAASQGAFAAVLAAAAWWTGVPAVAVGLGPGAAGPVAVGAGIALGVGLYVANEVGSVVGERFGVAGGEELRAALAPDTAVGWIVLLGVVLPVVAGFEEFLFRGVLIGAFAAGFPVPPALLAAGSSVAFALGHGAQGRAGVVLTGVLGAVLAAGFLLTGSLVTVIVAHYLVNALEFVVHEGFGVEW